MPRGGSSRSPDLCVARVRPSSPTLPPRVCCWCILFDLMVPFRAEALSHPQPHPRRSEQARRHGVLPWLHSYYSGTWPNQLSSRSLRPFFLRWGEAHLPATRLSRASCGTVNVDGLYELGHAGSQWQGLVRAISPQHLLILPSSQLGGPAGSRGLPAALRVSGSMLFVPFAKGDRECGLELRSGPRLSESLSGQQKDSINSSCRGGGMSLAGCCKEGVFGTQHLMLQGRARSFSLDS